MAMFRQLSEEACCQTDTRGLPKNLFSIWPPIQQNCQRGTLPANITKHIDVALRANVIERPRGMQWKIEQLLHAAALELTRHRFYGRRIESGARRVRKEQFVASRAPAGLISALSANLPTT